MVGHIHEDIDQLSVSCISRHLAKINVLTLLELIREIGRSYSPSIKASFLTFMYNVKQWMEGFTEASLSGHANQRQFKVVLYGMVRVTLLTPERPLGHHDQLLLYLSFPTYLRFPRINHQDIPAST